MNNDTELTEKVINRLNSIVRLKCFLSLDPIMWKEQCGTWQQSSSIVSRLFSCLVQKIWGFYNTWDDFIANDALCFHRRSMFLQCRKRRWVRLVGWLHAVLFSEKVKWSGTKQVILVLHNTLKSSWGTRSTPLQNERAGHAKTVIKGYRMSPKARTEITKVFSHRKP